MEKFFYNEKFRAFKANKFDFVHLSALTFFLG